MKNLQSIIVSTFIFPINNNSIIALWKKKKQSISINNFVSLKSTNQLLFQYWDWKKIQSISINLFQEKIRSIITNQLLIDIDWTKLLTLQCYCTVLVLIHRHSGRKCRHTQPKLWRPFRIFWRIQLNRTYWLNVGLSAA